MVVSFDFVFMILSYMTVMRVISRDLELPYHHLENHVGII